MDERLSSYIKRHAQKGFSYGEIENHLANNGWDRQEIREATNFVKANIAMNEAINEPDSDNSSDYSSNPGQRSKSSMALTFLAVFFVIALFSASYFFLSEDFFAGMMTGSVSKEPHSERAINIIRETNAIEMAEYSIDAKEWETYDTGDTRLLMLTKQDSKINIAELSSNGKSLRDYFDSVYSVVANMDGQSGNQVISTSETTINGRKAITMLRKYSDGGATIKLLQHYIEKDGKIYLINYEAEQSEFDRNKDSAMDVIETLKLK